MRSKDMLSIVSAVEASIRADFEIWPTVAELASLSGLPKRRLQQVFKAVHGKTVMAFARQLHLQHAHDLLVQHDYPLQVVCEMVGYPDASNFSTAFLNQFGYRPGLVGKAASPTPSMQRNNR